jgi:hypothetical protein
MRCDWGNAAAEGWRKEYFVGKAWTLSADNDINDKVLVGKAIELLHFPGSRGHGRARNSGAVSVK